MDSNRMTGSYYTSKQIAQYMVNWGIRLATDAMLEPSFGDGVFLDAAIRRYEELGIASPKVTCVELQESVYTKYMESAPSWINGHCQDFLSFSTEEKVSTIIGNPPYISLRNLNEEKRKVAIDCASQSKIRMLTSGSLWMPFIIHGTGVLSNGGRLAFVLPYELTYVKYAYPLWDFLANHYGDLSVIRIHEDFFPDVDVETILLLADDCGGRTDKVTFKVYDDVDALFSDVTSIVSEIRIEEITHGRKPFTVSLLSDEQREILSDIRKEGIIRPLIDICKFNIGYVCADKVYFHPSKTTCAEYGISPKSLIPCISNAKEINDTGIGAAVGIDEQINHLFLPINPSPEDELYIKHGVDIGVNLRYKCQKRDPWYLTPGVYIPDLILTVFGDTPKLLANNGQFAVSNSLLAGFLKPALCAEQAICMWYNSLTLLSIELNIHSLGGGVLVLIPGETDKLEIISNIAKSKAMSLFSQIDQCIKEKGIEAAYELGDKLVLKDIYGFSDEWLRMIKSAVKTLRLWRKTNIRRNKKR